MAEANTGAVKTLLCQTAQSALDPTFCADPLKPKGKEDVKFPHAQSALTLSHHQRPSSASISPAHTPSNTTPPPIQKFLTLHKCSSLEIIEYSSGDDSPVVIKKVSANKANISGLYQHQHLHQVGYYGSQENFLKFSMLPKTSKKTNFFRRSNRRSEFPLHYPKNSDALIRLLQSHNGSLDVYNDIGDAPIHAIVRHKQKRREDILLTLLIHGAGRVDVNCRTAIDCDTALHLAVMEEADVLVKMLLAFGADVNPINIAGNTPLDIAVENKVCNIVAFLVSVDGNTAENIMSKEPVIFHPLPAFERPPGLVDEDEEKEEKKENEEGKEEVDEAVVERRDHDSRSASVETDEATLCGSREEMVLSQGQWRQVTLRDMEEGKTEVSLFQRLNESINCNLSFSGSFSANVDEAIALTQQQRELLRYRKTKQSNSTTIQLRPGSRVLCLDGGGIRGLIQIEVLRQLEEHTGRKVTELFDWIVGTSTGGVLALGLVYAKKTLSQLRQLYFKLKDRVFAHERLGFAYNTAALEKLLKDEFGTEMTMKTVSYPRVLITAVYKKTTQPELHFFNNCFNDEFSNQLVWKVARYTSAAPLSFSEMDHYVDGGVLANNPCEYGLTAINNYYRGDRGVAIHNANSLYGHQKEGVSLVVSVGTGLFPAEELGNTDAQQFLFFGSHWFKPKKSGPVKTVENLIKLLVQALLDSESVAENCASRLQQKGIPFHRFNPHLEEAIPAGEINNEKLLNMIMQTRYQTMGVHMDELARNLHGIRGMMQKRVVIRNYRV